jgi:hypothetical protein
VTDVAAIAEGLTRIEARGPCTDAERRAAGSLHDALRAEGHEAWVETHWVRPQWALSLALHATIGVVASVAALAAPLPALVAAALAALSMTFEATGRVGPLRLLFPRRATQNVVTVPDEGGITLLICARYDAARGGLATRDGARRLAARLRRLLRGRGVGPRAWVAIALALVGVCAGLRLLDLEGAWLGVLQFVPTAALLGALAAAGDIAVSPISLGGESAPAVAVALYAELRRNPPAALSPALLLDGAGEGGPQALRAHLRRDRPDRAAIVVLELGPCGAGTPAFAAAHPQLRAAAARAADAVGGGGRAPLRHASGAGAARARRLPAAWIGALDADGIAPNGTLDPAAAERTLDFALACVDALDAELGASPPGVDATRLH